MAVITISRQYGSGGDEIAKRLCEILGYHYFDKQLMLQVAAEIGFSENELVDFSEENYKVRGFFNRLFGSRPVAQVETWKRDVSTGAHKLEIEELDEEQCVRMIQVSIGAAYRQGNLVILGRGGQAILKEAPGVLHVRIEAPLGARVMRVQEKENLSLLVAEERVRARDQATASYLRRFYGIDWSDPMNYHLIINTGKWDLENAAHIVVNALSQLRVVKE